MVYAAVVVFVTLVAVAIGNVAYTNHVDGRRARSAEQARRAQVEQGEQTLAVVCRLVVAQVDAYADQPPQTAVGRNVAETWALLKVQLGC